MNAQSNRSGKRNLNIWYPRDFNHYISIAGYIKDKIDPISIEIAKAYSKRTN